VNVAAIMGGFAQTASGERGPRAVAQEFEALLLKMLLETARIPGGKQRDAPIELASGFFATLFAQQVAASHGAGFGDLVLRALTEGGKQS
jgi:Rod binding domain-containing protein